MEKQIEATCKLRPRSNPYPEGSELARAYEEGWQKAYLQSSELLEHVTEVIEGAQFCHELFIEARKPSSRPHRASISRRHQPALSRRG